MADAPSYAGGGADIDRLSIDLTAFNDDVQAAALDLERLIALGTSPDGGVLASARLRFSRALRVHLQHVDGAVLPALRRAADARMRAAIDEYRRVLHDYHEAAAHHVARWPSAAVTADWDGYRHSVADMLARLSRRVAVEQRIVHPLLTRTGDR
ncbi:hypothetical protein [uncultured Sphingomonas sp.]|uniref:hypothetical protein n=1 Tax=uncultured Sphingomonas sp. TaxID=158754 RepID=UPI0035CAF1FD